MVQLIVIPGNFFLMSTRCPERSRREDIWLRGKTWVRKNFASIQIFDEAIQIFRDCLSGEYFSFDKIRNYVTL